jgi:nucleotide-binding universal stress UspA family protein
MYKKILVPLDGSQLAEVALPYAEELSGRLGSEIILIYVHEPVDAINQRMREFYLQKMVESVSQSAEKYSSQSGKKTTNNVRAVILSGNPAEEIVKYADKEDISLIVMSTHGESGIRQWSLGSVASKVVRVTSRPVALIRAATAQPDKLRKKGILNKVLVPLDGSAEGEIVIPYVEELASKLKARIMLLQVLETGYPGYKSGKYEYQAYSEQELQSNREIALNYLSNIASQLKQEGLEVETGVKFGEASLEIISFAAEKKADIIAMSTHGRSGIGNWVLGSVAARVLYEGQIPLLLVRRSKG